MGPRGLSAFQFLLPFLKQLKKASIMQKCYEIVLVHFDKTQVEPPAPYLGVGGFLRSCSLEKVFRQPVF